MLFFICILGFKIQNSEIKGFYLDGTTDRNKVYSLTAIKHGNDEDVHKCLIEEILKVVPQTKLNEIDALFDSSGGFYNDERIIEMSQHRYNPLTVNEAKSLAYYLYLPDLSQKVDLELNTGYTSKFDCFFDSLKRAFDKLEEFAWSPSYKDGSNFKPEQFKVGQYVSTRTFVQVCIDYNHMEHVNIIIKIYANKNNIKSVQDLLRKKPTNDDNILIFPPATLFKVKNEPYIRYCNINKMRSDCYDKKNSNDLKEITFIELEEIDEFYGPIKYRDPPEVHSDVSVIPLNFSEEPEYYTDDEPTISNKSSASKNILIIVSVVVGIILIGIVCLVIFFIYKKRTEATKSNNIV